MNELACPEALCPTVNSSPDLVPFGPGDMLGKRSDAAAHARAQLAVLEPGSVRANLYALQAALADSPEVNCPLQHVFVPGACARTIFIPAGSVLVGKIHKHQHLNVLSQGLVTVFTEAGGKESFQGPLTMSSSPGTKRIVLAHTDVVWTTIHITNAKDALELEQDVIAETYDEYEKFRLQAEGVTK